MSQLTRIAKTNRPILGVLLLYFILPVLLFPEIVFGGQTLYQTDISWIHYPRHIFAAEEWLAGRIPLWDPYQHNGLPFLAESQVGVLYLPSIIFLSSLSPSFELSLYILLHFSLGAIFTFFLARSLGLAYAPATVSGLVFGFGGFLMAQVPNLNIMTGSVWLPLILLATMESVRRRRLSVSLVAGIPFALQIFTAQPQVVVYSILTVLGYGVYRLVADYFNVTPRSLKHAARSILLTLTPLLSGLLLASPQWLATLELQQLSVRSSELGLGFLVKNSLPPVMLLNLVLPSLFGNNVTGFKGGDPFQEDFLYIGFVPLVLIFFSVPQYRRRDALFFPVLLLAGLLLALGNYTPLYEYVIQYLPGVSLFRIPSRWLLVVSLALAIMAGMGFQTILEKGISRLEMWIISAVTIVVLIGLGLLWFFQAEVTVWADGRWGDFYRKLLNAFYEYSYIPHRAYQDQLLKGWSAVPVLGLTVNIVIAMSMFWLYACKRLSRRLFSLLLIAAAGGTTVNPTEPAGWWQQLSGGASYVLENADDARVFPLGMGSEALAVSHLGHYFPAVYRIRSAGGHGSSLMLSRIQTFLDEAHPVQAVRVMGVRYLLTEGMMGADAAATFPIVFADDQSFVYENFNPLPRAFMVHRLVPVTSPDEALSYLKDTELDLAQAVVIEGAGLPSPTTPSQPGKTTIVRETSQTVELVTESEADSYLVLLDTFYPGWVGSIDDQPVQIFRANYIARALFVPAGQHKIRFEYRPVPFWIGVVLAFTTMLLITGLLVYDKIARNSGKPS